MTKKILIDTKKLENKGKKLSSFSYTNNKQFEKTKEAVKYTVDSEIERIRRKSQEFKNQQSINRNIKVNSGNGSKHNPIEFISPLGNKTKRARKIEDNEKYESDIKAVISSSKQKIMSKKILLDPSLSNPIQDNSLVSEQKVKVNSYELDNDNTYKNAQNEIIRDKELDIDIGNIDHNEVSNDDIYLFDEEQIKVYESFTDQVENTVSSNDYLVRKTSLIESIRDTSDPFAYFSDDKGFVLSNNTEVFHVEVMPKLAKKQPQLVKVEEDVKHYSGNIDEELLTARKNKKHNEKVISNHESEKESTPLKPKSSNYTLPSINLLDNVVKQNYSNEGLEEKIVQLETFFKNFKIDARVENSTIGPTVARFELSIAAGTKVSKISNLRDDIKLALASKDVRIEAPIPGKNLIGIEIPAMKSRTIKIKEIIQNKSFKDSSKLSAALGVSIDNIPTYLDVASMPHGLISGSTGSGKSVSINALLVSLLYKNNPNELKLILVDPKVVELSPYNGIPHLLSPVISDPKEALNSLKWAAQEMDRRYTMFSKTNTRNIESYNAISEIKMPKIVIIIDELADLMMVASNEVELYITRIAQKSRAAGIHMILATQRPSVEVITGLIKANIPTRVAFAVSSSIDSRTILDQTGAETLLGRGDMLFSERGKSPIRLQAPFITDDEINNVISHWQQYGSASSVDFKVNEKENDSSTNSISFDDDFVNVAEFVITSQKASTSLIQRKFSFGYNKAARIIDNLEELNVIGGQNGTKPREVNMTLEEFNSLREEYERD